MKYSIGLLLIIGVVFFSSAQQKTVYGDLRSTDSTHLNIIRIFPDTFPVVSIIFEAVKAKQPIFGLESSLLTVTENGAPCKIVKIHPIEDNYPINISLIIDHSESMLHDEWQLYDSITGKPLFKYVMKNGFVDIEYPKDFVKPIDNAKKAVSDFIQALSSSKDSIQIVGFSSSVDIYSGFSTDKKYLQSYVNKINADYSTAFLDAINFSLDSTKKHSGIKAVIALTDGMDNSSHVSIKDVIKKSKEFKIPVYTIGLGDVDKEFLKQISEQTGGAFYYTTKSSSLSGIYKQIQERIHAIYDLQYESENFNESDSIREVKIEFVVDSLYLSENINSYNLSEKAIQYIKEKKKREKYILIGGAASAVAVSSGIILFYIRRKKKKE